MKNPERNYIYSSFFIHTSTLEPLEVALRGDIRDDNTMEKLLIRGGRRLNGDIRISGMKNAALPILYACALNRETCVLQNVPTVSDIDTTVAILSAMGADIRYTDPTTMEINCANIRVGTSPEKFVRKIRASSYLMGVELALEGRTSIAYPGGCQFGSRPLDYHIRGFELMGAEMTTHGKGFSGIAPDGLHECKIMLDFPSVGATVNLVLASVFTPGTTIIGNAAREPHIVAMAVFLNQCGARITGAGNSEIRVEGVSRLHGCTYKIPADMIEAGTYMAAVAATGGCVTLHDVIPKHLESVSSKLMEMGVTVEEGDDTITVVSDGMGSIKPTQIITAPYPGFPTDMQPQFAILQGVAQGISRIDEKVSIGRFFYLEELKKTGMRIASQTEYTVCIEGVDRLYAAPMKATDLRGGAAMVIAGLIAEGVSEITSLEYIDRGYDDLIGKLRSLGADIVRISYTTDDETVTVKAQA